jgi:hypothetical protein
MKLEGCVVLHNVLNSAGHEGHPAFGAPSVSSWGIAAVGGEPVSSRQAACKGQQVETSTLSIEPTHKRPDDNGKPLVIQLPPCPDRGLPVPRWSSSHRSVGHAVGT